MRKIQVVAGIVWKDGCFLAARRSPGKRGEGFWEFPGGKIELDETREQALARELKEELGIEVSDCEYWKSEEHSYAGYIIALHFYHVREFSNTPMMIEGHDALAWVSPNDVGYLEFLPADAQILRELKEFYPAGPEKASKLP